MDLFRSFDRKEYYHDDVLKLDLVLPDEAEFQTKVKETLASFANELQMDLEEYQKTIRGKLESLPQDDASLFRTISSHGRKTALVLEETIDFEYDY